MASRQQALAYIMIKIDRFYIIVWSISTLNLAQTNVVVV